MKHGSKEVFRLNVIERLAKLEVLAYAASKAAGKRGGWIGDMLNPKRTPKGVPLDVLDEVADVLGVPRHELLNPGVDMRQFAAPAWVDEAISRSKAPADRSARDML
jgi:hypothetical protein